MSSGDRASPFTVSPLSVLVPTLLGSPTVKGSSSGHTVSTFLLPLRCGHSAGIGGNAFTGQRTTGAKKALKMVKGDRSIRDSGGRSEPCSQPFSS